MTETDPPHSILWRPHLYAIEALALEVEPEDGSEPHLDLRLSLAGEVVELRFWSPSEVSIGWPLRTSGLAILDLSARGMEFKVQVADFEASPGGIRFFARTVERIYRDRGAG